MDTYTATVSSVANGNTFEIEEPIDFNGIEYTTIKLDDVKVPAEGKDWYEEIKYRLTGFIDDKPIIIKVKKADKSNNCLIAEVKQSGMSVNRYMVDYVSKLRIKYNIEL